MTPNINEAKQNLRKSIPLFNKKLEDKKQIDMNGKQAA
jgi:hypothetical protein